MFLALEDSIISISDSELNDEVLKINGNEFTNKAELKIIKKQVDSDLKSGKSLVDLRGKIVPDFVKFIFSNETLKDSKECLNLLTSFSQIPEKNYSVLKTPVTQELYEAVMGENPSLFEGKENPVENVSLYDALYFCNKLSELYGLELVYSVDGKTNVSEWNYVSDTENSISGKIIQHKNANGFRLPTIKEWLYAAKGGSDYIYSGSDNLDEVGWFSGNSEEKTQPVAQKKPNGYGLYDMSGNVWEWCWKSYGGIDSSCRCGGSWDSDSFMCDLEVNNNFVIVDNKHGLIGFRIVRTIVNKESKVKKLINLEDFQKYSKKANEKNVEEFEIENGVLKKYHGTASEVIIPEGITAIEEDAFKDCTSLKKVVIPKGCKVIGAGEFFFYASNVFANCSNLEEVIIPDTVEVIEGQAFYGCTSLKEITIPDSVKVIEPRTFEGCTSLEKITIPNSVKIIGEEAFKECSSLKKVNLPEQLEEIHQYAFCKTALSYVFIPKGVKKIEQGAFNSCYNLEEVVISDGVKVIEGSFEYCRSLKKVTIPNSIEEIGKVCFRECQIKELNHPLLKIENGLAIKDGCVLYCADSSIKNVVIPETVTKIHNCESSNMESVVIPASVKSIENMAFFSCTSLKSVELTEGLKTIGEAAFFGCENLTSVSSIPSTVKSIGYCAFGNCDKLKPFPIPKTVKSVRKMLFAIEHFRK